MILASISVSIARSPEKASASPFNCSMFFLSAMLSSSLDLSMARTDSKRDFVSVTEFQSIFSKSITGTMP